ncbi:MAG: M3 family metallopeptidase [Candidatus Saccharimonadales bacterium]
MPNNSLIHKIGEVHFDKYKPKDTKQALENGEKLVWERVEELLAIPKDKRTFENTVLALSRSAQEFGLAATMADHLNSVLGETWEEAAILASEKSSSLSNQLDFHEGIYQALLDLEQKSEYIKSLNKPQRKLLKDLIKDYKRSGIDLPKDKKKQLQNIRSKLSKATTEFDQNVVKSSDKAGILVANGEELAGLDQDFINSCKEAAQDKDLEGYWVQYSQPIYTKIMSECSVRSTRKAMYRVHISRTTNINKEVARDILQLRQQKAELLGYENHADFILQDRMAKNLETVTSFLDDLKPRYQQKHLEEVKTLEEFARKLEADDDLEIDASDIDTGLDFYYNLRMREKENSIDFKKVREYFPLASVLETMFDTLSTIYGVSFEQVDIPTWHGDVEVYDIQDEDGSHLATVWCDWYARKGKRPGAWMNAFYAADRGSKQQPEGGLANLGLVCANFTPPSSNQPGLLDIRDIETIWHEFGHFMHLALSDNQLREQNIMDCLWDFIEAPSQIMENWVWQPEILKSMSAHYQTGEKLPQATIDKILADRNFMVASKAMRQLGLASVDISLHTQLKDQEDIIAHGADVKQEFLAKDIYEEEATILSFSHIFAGGYACGYYSYKWAESIEADLFTRFEKEGALNPQVGKSYRQEVLARGSEVEPQVLIKNFLGRDFDTKSMLKREGLL